MIILGNKQCTNYINLVPSKKTPTIDGVQFYAWKSVEGVNNKLYYTLVEKPTNSDIMFGGDYFVNTEVYGSETSLENAIIDTESLGDDTITFKEGEGEWAFDVTVLRDSLNDGTFVQIQAYEQDGWDNTKPSMIHKSPNGKFYTMIETEDNTYYTDVDMIINSNEIVDNGDGTITYDGATYIYDETPTYHRKDMLENKGLI